jgi:sulfur transfer protein SufE
MKENEMMERKIVFGGSSVMKSNTEMEKLRRELKRVREENRKLKHIITYGNMLTLETLIDQYMDYSRVHLKKIALEIQLTDYEKGGTAKVMELIEHLEYIKEELYKLIEIGEEGEIIDNESLKHDVRIARELIPKLESIIQLQIDKKQSEEMEKILTEFVQRFRKCF